MKNTAERERLEGSSTSLETTSLLDVTTWTSDTSLQQDEGRQSPSPPLQDITNPTDSRSARRRRAILADINKPSTPIPCHCPDPPRPTPRPPDADIPAFSFAAFLPRSPWHWHPRCPCARETPRGCPGLDLSCRGSQYDSDGLGNVQWNATRAQIIACGDNTQSRG